MKAPFGGWIAAPQPGKMRRDEMRPRQMRQALKSGQSCADAFQIAEGITSKTIRAGT
jgi:hypothetical protein